MITQGQLEISSYTTERFKIHSSFQGERLFFTCFLLPCLILSLSILNSHVPSKACHRGKRPTPRSNHKPHVSEMAAGQSHSSCDPRGSPGRLQPLQHQLRFLGDTPLASGPSVTAKADLEDRNVIVMVVLSEQGHLGPLPARLLWVADCEVSGVELEQSEYFYLDFKGVCKYKHVDLGMRQEEVTG